MLGRAKIVMKCAPVLSRRELEKLPARVRRLFRREKSCKFRLRGKLKAARFVNKKDKREFAIVHPSTKRKGMCQVSYFDKDGPYRDTQYNTCSRAIKDLSPRQWKLVETQ